MTWTAPADAVTGNTLTAAFWNAQVRDNMLETAAATAAAAGDVVYADAANSMGSVLTHPGQSRMLVSDASSGLAWRQPAEGINFSAGATSETDSDTTYVVRWGTEDLPSVTVTTGTAAIVIVSAQYVFNDTQGAWVSLSYSVSGATTQAASDDRGSLRESDPAGSLGGLVSLRRNSLTAGSNTFQMEAKVSAGTGTINRPRILVIPL